jgi:uncharacterized protein
MTTTSLADGHRPRPLPIRPPPQSGETPISYARRLARANHLRTGYLIRYLREGAQDGQIQLDRLAVLAARPVTSLERAFAQNPPPRRPHPGGQRQRKTDLFAVIRQDADETGRSVRALADRHGVHRRTVQQALASPIPARRKQLPTRPSRLDPFKDTINAILQQELDDPHQPTHTTKEIFDHLVTEHAATGISYSIVRDYVAGRRRTRPRRTRAGTVTPTAATPPSVNTARRIPAMTWSPAHIAVEHQDLPRLRDLLDAGHDVEDDNGDGWTLLRHAIDSEHDGHTQTGQPLQASITAFLLARGADPLRQHNGVPAVVEAETRGHWLAAEIMTAWIRRDGPASEVLRQPRHPGILST